MTINHKLRMDERFSWSFVGAILGLLGVVFAVVTLYLGFRENRAELVYQIENQSDVFDLHRPLKDLTLSFRGQDVQQQNLNLRILTVRLWNRGSKDILQDQYDQAEAWGIRVEPGQIIEVRIGENNSQYLASRINPRITAENKIELEKVILEHDKFITLDILVLHHKDTPPKIMAFGKIAGIEQINVLDASAQRGKPSFWSQLWSGTLLIQVVRFLTSFVLLIVLVFIAFGVSEAKDAYLRAVRRKHVTNLTYEAGLDPKILGILKESYARDGIAGLENVDHVLKKHEDALLKRIDDFQGGDEKQMKTASPDGTHASGDADFNRLLGIARGRDAIFQLIKEGFISRTSDQKILIDPRVTEMLSKLLKQLK
jgi:hypothetical protein